VQQTGKSVDVYAIGNALVDIQAHIPEAFLREIDYAKGLMTLVELSTQRTVLGKLAGTSIVRNAGGSAANTAVGIAQFGGRCTFCGKLGADEPGEFFLRDMRELGVGQGAAPVPGGETGTCVVLITDDAQRTMLTCLGQASTLSAADVAREQVRAAKYIYVEGYLFGGEPTRSAALAAIKLAQDEGVKVALTVSDPFLIQYHRDEFWKLIEGPVDLLFCNLEEARALTGLHDAVDCAKEIHRHAENVALTLGADGSILMHAGEVIAVSSAPVHAVDTTGAGDMYAAGILYGITNGLSWRQAGRLASLAAGRVVSQLGARLRQPLTNAQIVAAIGE
jgi:sugar/nucleoside kinase (ribokinase family)